MNKKCLIALNEYCHKKIIEQPVSDQAHDISHILRVVKNAQKITEYEKANWQIVLPAAWLHDCICYPKTHPLRAQSAYLAADQAVEWLQQWGYPADYLPQVHHAIVAHSYSAGVIPTTIEAKIVQDADRLDALGAIGLARCLQVGGTQQLALYDCNDPFCRQRIPDDKRYILDHYFQKLRYLPESLHTNFAKQLATERLLFLEQFIAQLATEI
ncbi:HD domain-containing protein [Photobacterium kishitanii]|uniref:HD domain-containing protein n=1 Tax=Photobacterium kishitanii TaxID=318456 RepID=UPI0007F8D7C9|nr:HD domain-containing protein [Photobacterium kishitanii]OBU30172.1 phosphohydrolase [Photobacterium kishitanii]PSW46808.1 HD domain-containing protein [Photobacterium kishitanii]